MESNDYNGGFEHFLKEKSDQYKLYPSDRVWSAIHDKLHPRSKWPYVVVAAIFIGLGIGGNIYDSSIAGGSARKEAKRQQPNGNTSLAVLNASHDPYGPAAKAGGPASPFTGERSALPYTAGAGEAVSREDRSSGGLRVVHLNRELATANIRTSQATTMRVAKPELALVDNKDTDASPDGAATQPAASAETESLIINDKVRIPATINLDLKTAKPSKMVADTRKDMPKTTAIRVLRPYKHMFGLQFYVTPTISYRQMFGQGIKTFNPSTGAFSYSGDVNSIVAHKPMMGTEAGMALVFSMNKKLRFKTGLQFNMAQYEVQAYRYTAELVPMTAAGIGHSQVNAISTFRSTAGLSQATLRNQHLMISIPVGAELSLYDSRNIQFNIGGSLQPTYVVNNQSYMISSDLKNYAQAPSLYKNFNLNGAVEAFISVKRGTTKYNFGPQVRYQLMSSYKPAYPINERLLEYGFKIGVTKTLK